MTIFRLRGYIEWEKPDVFYTRHKTRRVSHKAKFSISKDGEFIRERAPLTLKGSNIRFNEQFPPEVEEERRKLYPSMRMANRENKRMKL